MRNRLLLFGLLLLSATTFSCRTDFEVNEKWKEIDIIYGLLDINDSTHYVKIGKAFLNDDESAYKIAAVEDSLYHRDSLDVSLQAIENGKVVLQEKLQKTYLSNKHEGTFASPGQFLYKLPEGSTIDPKYTYKIIVKNTSSGVEASSKTTLVGDLSPITPRAQSTITFVRSFLRPVEFNIGKNAKFYELNILINYSEYNSTDSTKIKDDVIRWPVFSNYVVFPSNPKLTYNIKGDDFYKILIDQLPSKDKVYRKIGKLDFQITGGGEEIYNYINVYKPSIGIVQKKPEYTNIENGQGVFSSRNRALISVPLSSATLDELITGPPTRHLNFRK